MKKEKVIFFWSGGKDSALALYKVLTAGEYHVSSLLTTLNKNHHRISMHGVREKLLDSQAKAVELPLTKMWVQEGSNEEYERLLREQLAAFKSAGINKVIFGDIFLDDLREYRDRILAAAGMEGVYPLWKQNTSQLMEEFLSLGFKTITCCINDALLTEQHAGQVIDRDFIEQLPAGVDPCGENGEFHSFAFDGPVFKKPIPFDIGEKVYRPLEVKFTKAQKPDGKPLTKGFWFCDLMVNG